MPMLILGYFDNIIPCGIKGKAVTSMEAELNRKVDIEEVKAKILKHFKVLFEVEEFIEVLKKIPLTFLINISGIFFKIERDDYFSSLKYTL